MPTSYHTSTGSTLTRPRSNYGSSYTTTTTAARIGRSLPPGPGPLDSSGKPLLDIKLKQRTSPTTTGPLRADHKVSFESTYRISDRFESKRSPGVVDGKYGGLSDGTNSYTSLSNRRRDRDSFETTSYNVYGTGATNRYGDRSTPTSRYSSSLGGGYTSDSENRAPAGLVRRRSSVSEKITQFEPSYRNYDHAVSGIFIRSPFP